MIKIPIFVLTLENRRDRQETVTTSLEEVGVSFQFTYSNKNENTQYEPMLKATQIEVAIWASHIKALQALLETDSQWGLILEDDFTLLPQGIDLLKNQNSINAILESLSDDYSILQIGFLENSYSSNSRKAVGILFKILFQFNRFDLRSRLDNFRYLGLTKTSSIDRVLKICGLKKTKILYGLRLGTHAYFINRGAASLLTDIFKNRESDKNFMTIDQYLLTQTRDFTKEPQISAARLSNSLVAQSTSPSDNFGKTSVEVLES
jgi:GR25 family glycosyltransferase involved in LPS biosynthesis